MKYYQSITLTLMLLLSAQAKALVIFQEYTNTRLEQGSTFFTHTFDPFDVSLGTLTRVQFEGFTQMTPVYDSFHCGEVGGCNLYGETWAAVDITIQTTGHSATIFGNPSAPTGTNWVAAVSGLYTAGLDDFTTPPQFRWHGGAFCSDCLSSSGQLYNLAVRSSVLYTYTPATVALPSSIALMSVGLAGLLPLLRRRAVSF